MAAGNTALYGPDHRDTLAAQGNLAITLSDLGDVGRARALYEAVLERQLATLGPAHGDTLHTQGNLSALLFKTGDLAGARVLDEAVVAGRTELLGAAHEQTLRARGNLALTLSDLGDHDAVRRPPPSPSFVSPFLGRFEVVRPRQARAEYAAVLAAKKEAIGPRHPSTLNTQHGLAVLLGDELGEVGEACALMREVAAARTAVQGAAHAHTRRSARNLAKWEAQLKG